MPFSEKTKLEAKKRSSFRCCICHKIFVEIHHIIPKSQGGSDDIDNAAPLCASCHDLFGGNPEKRKQIKEMRDHWWSLMSLRKEKLSKLIDIDNLSFIDENPEKTNQLHTQKINIYHNILAEENFEESAKTIFNLVKKSIKSDNINKKRVLFLDIEGHVNKNNNYDHDMSELQIMFIPNMILPFVSEVYMPLFSIKNDRPQKNDIPPNISILKNVENNLSDLIKSENSLKIYLANSKKWINTHESDFDI